MPLLLVHVPGGTERIELAERQSVREALDATVWRVRAACGGSGTCGACLVTLLGGEVTPPTVAEYMKLPPEERAAGVRLACQLRLLGDAEIRLDLPAPPSPWKSLPPENLFELNISRPELTEHPYAVAIDLGTTHIRAALWDRQHGKRLATRSGPNPQADFGADVLNRLSAAQASPQRAAELAYLARHAIDQAIRDMLARDIGEVSPMLPRIGEIFIVGNTAMLALLTCRGADDLSDPANWEAHIDCQPSDPEAWTGEWHLPNATIALPPTVAGFVGSDLLADLVATGIAETADCGMLLDIGTNTEIALWDGTTLHVTSVPGGPAFEGVGIRHGMPAEPGAICRVAASNESFSCTTIGGTTARGFCGSGLTDAIAVLLADGQLKPSGRFTSPPGPDGLQLIPGNPRSAIVGGDIDAFQRAKAAVTAGMAALLREAGKDWSDLQRLCVCGAFGRTLDIGHAQALGLLPAIDRKRIELIADTSLAGCEIGLLLPDGTKRFSQLAARSKLINLSLRSDYDESYIDHLRLRPVIGPP